MKEKVDGHQKDIKNNVQQHIETIITVPQFNDHPSEDEVNQMFGKRTAKEKPPLITNKTPSINSDVKTSKSRCCPCFWPVAQDDQEEKIGSKSTLTVRK